MYEMQTIVIDDPGVCQSACHMALPSHHAVQTWLLEVRTL